MKKQTKAEKMAEHAEVLQEAKIAKKRLLQLARFVVAIEKHIYGSGLYADAEAHKLLVKNPKHPHGCQDSQTCTGAPEDPCHTIAHWIREVAATGAPRRDEDED